MTVDLFEEKNLGQVVQCVHSLGGLAQRAGFSGPVLGVRVAQRNVREFDEETLAQGKSAVPLLVAGAAKGANASGIRYGARREIGGADQGK